MAERFFLFFGWFQMVGFGTPGAVNRRIPMGIHFAKVNIHFICSMMQIAAKLVDLECFAFLVIFYFHPFLGAFRWDYFLFFWGFLKQIQV